MRRRMFALLFAALLLHGCSDYHELEELVIVTGAGIDLTAEGGITLTAEVLRTEEAQAGAGTPTATYTVRSDSIAGCDRELQRYVGGRIYWGHAEVILFSRAALERCFSETLDWVLRDNEARLTVVFAQSCAETAAELFSAETGSFSAGKTMVQQMKSGPVPGAAEEGAAFRLKNRLEGGSPAMLPLLDLTEAEDYRSSGSSGERGESGMGGMAQMSGSGEGQQGSQQKPQESGTLRVVPAGAVLLTGGGEDPTQVTAAARLNARQAQLLMLSRGCCAEDGCIVEGPDWTVSVQKVTARRSPGRLTLAGSCDIARYSGGARNHLTQAETERCAGEAADLLAAELAEALEAAAPAFGPPPAIRVKLTPASTGLISG